MNSPFIEPSPLAVAVFGWFASRPGRWGTNADVGQVVGVSSARSIRAITAKLHLSGVLERREVFGGYRFRLNDNPGRDATGVIQQLREAREALSEFHPATTNGGVL